MCLFACFVGTVFAIKVCVESVMWDSLRVSLLCSITVAQPVVVIVRVLHL